MSRVPTIARRRSGWQREVDRAVVRDRRHPAEEVLEEEARAQRQHVRRRVGQHPLDLAEARDGEEVVALRSGARHEHHALDALGTHRLGRRASDRALCLRPVVGPHERRDDQEEGARAAQRRPQRAHVRQVAGVHRDPPAHGGRQPCRVAHQHRRLRSGAQQALHHPASDLPRRRRDRDRHPCAPC
jgi:hypothetical protein